MEQIKIDYAEALNGVIALYRRAVATSANQLYFIGHRAAHHGYTPEAYFDGEILAEIPEHVADCLPAVRYIKNKPDELKYYNAVDLLAAAEVLGICDALAYPLDPFANLEITDYYTAPDWQ